MPDSVMSSHVLGEFVDLGEKKMIGYLQIPKGLGHDVLIDLRAQPSLRSMSFYQASKEICRKCTVLHFL